MTLFVALGDSITAGYGDPMPGGTRRGWAAILAGALGADLHNLAVSGALTHDVGQRQLPRALELRPDVAAVVVGVNDTLRGSFDPERIGHTLDATVAALRAVGAVVLTARLPDPGLMLRLPGALARPLFRRIQAVNAVADAVAARHGTLHFNAADHPATYDRRMWSVDRLHPSERGHRLLAASFFDLAAGVLGVPPAARPSAEPGNPDPTFSAQAWWMATRGTQWLVRRSTDLVPCLVKMMITEWLTGAPAGPSGAPVSPAGESPPALPGRLAALAGLPSALVGGPVGLAGVASALAGGSAGVASALVGGPVGLAGVASALAGGPAGVASAVVGGSVGLAGGPSALSGRPAALVGVPGHLEKVS